jgi:hypothetical protein
MTRQLLAAIAALTIGAASHDVLAQTRATLVPAVQMGAIYDDNVNSRAQGDAGEMLQVRPSLEADYESPRVTLISLWSFDMQRSNHSALNSLFARGHGMFDSKFRPSSATTWAVVSRFDRTESPGEIDFDSGVLTDRRNTQRWEVSPSVLHRIGERATVSAVYDWTTENLLTELASGSHISLHAARANATRLLSTRTSVTAGYLGRLFVDSAAEHQSHAALFGWTRELRPLTTFSLEAGPRWTSYRGLVPEVSASLGHEGQRIKTGLDYSHGETIILGVDGPVQIDTGSARLTVAATRKVEYGIRIGASSILSLDDRAATVYRGTALGSWSIAGPLTLVASYSVDYQLGDIRRNFFADQRVLRHVARVGVTLAPRLTRSFLPPEEAARARGVSR